MSLVPILKSHRCQKQRYLYFYNQQDNSGKLPILISTPLQTLHKFVWKAGITCSTFFLQNSITIHLINKFSTIFWKNFVDDCSNTANHIERVLIFISIVDSSICDTLRIFMELIIREIEWELIFSML